MYVFRWNEKSIPDMSSDFLLIISKCRFKSPLTPHFSQDTVSVKIRNLILEL